MFAWTLQRRNLFMLLAMLQCDNFGRRASRHACDSPSAISAARRIADLHSTPYLGFNLNKLRYLLVAT